MKIPDRISNEIADVVNQAISENIDPKSFVREVQACWELELEDKKRRDNKTFNELLK